MRALGWLCAIAAACSGRGVGDGGADGGSSGGSSVGEPSGSSGASMSATSSGTSTTSSSSSDTLMTGYDSDLTLDDDGPGPCDFYDCGIPCNPWQQDCPAGEKCNPFANDGGNLWNDYVCVPLDPDPQQPGESCMVEGGPTSGIDNCEVASMCFGVDPDTGIGECVAFCTGAPDLPTCEAECHECSITGEGVLILCLPKCDPLAQVCGAGSGCYPANDGFACSLDESSGGGGPGQPCDFANDCAPGWFCADPATVPSCGGMGGCCASFCDVMAADPCPGADPAVECVPWWEPGQQPMDGCIAGTLGACALP